MSPIQVVLVIVGAAVVVGAFLLALRYRRDGGVKMFSGRWYAVVLMSSVGTALVVVPTMHAWVLPALRMAQL